MGEEEKDVLRRMHGEITRCTACPLHESRKNAVPGEGPLDARLMLIGEAPGVEEDETGRPFCGRSGDFLDELFDDVGLDRAETYITSVVKCRPPGNRNPHVEERDTCQELWLNEQIELVDPDIVLLLGKIALRQVLDDNGTLRALHGQVRAVGGRRYVMTYHPAAGMRFPDAAQRMREDFQLLRDLLAE